jgi:hypothetical protein
MENYRFDLSEWLPRLPLKSEHDRFSGTPITSPSHICNNEQLRVAIAPQVDWGVAVPVDVFVMAKGEPCRRHATKVGGLPYRPCKLAWPTSPAGEPLTFLAQFCFSDSKDLTGELPGDVLLFFAESAEAIFDGLHYEWYPLGLTGLIGEEGVPE